MPHDTWFISVPHPPNVSPPCFFRQCLTGCSRRTHFVHQETTVRRTDAQNCCPAFKVQISMPILEQSSTVLVSLALQTFKDFQIVLQGCLAIIIQPSCRHTKNTPVDVPFIIDVQAYHKQGAQLGRICACTYAGSKIHSGERLRSDLAGCPVRVRYFFRGSLIMRATA